MKKRVRLLVILLVFLLVSFYLPTPYHLLKPGVALPLENSISIQGETYPKRGDFFLTAVSTERASLAELFYFFFFSPEELELVRLDTRLPEGVDMEDYIHLMEELMEESKLKAKVVALQQVEEEAQVTGQGALVVEILEESRAQELLKPGDIIFSADGRSIALATELVQLVDSRTIGEPIQLGVKREEEVHYFSVSTREFPDRPGRPSIGILIRSHEMEYQFSRDIQIMTNRIIGPSAGLMFTLEIINQLTLEDITSGRKIAGTGTIDLEGNIGPIDGVVQKIYSAQRQGAQVFILPEKNREDVEGYEFPIQLVVADTIEEVLEILLQDGASAKILPNHSLLWSLVEECIEVCC